MLRWLVRLLIAVLTVAVLGLAGGLYAMWEYGRELPEYRQLATYEPPTVTRVHAGDGRLLAEYATEKRVFVPIEAIPRRVIDAFLAAEDGQFYSHPGINVLSIVRATVQNVMHYFGGKRLVGASTITQQVAKNFLLTNEVSIERKIKEAILAFRIERAFTKDRILELYLNEIYLGFGSYGVAAAALNYFNKALADLTIAEAAYLAALPKAPNNYHPITRYKEAVARRDWVIGRMLELGFISEDEAGLARASILLVRTRDETEVADAPYFAEEVRRGLIARYGEDGLYGGGLSVRATLDPRLQAIADAVLRQGLVTYDRRHGWRGPLGRIEVGAGWVERLAAVERPGGLAPWRLAAVLNVGPGEAEIGLSDGETGTIPLAEAKWARPWLAGQRIGASIKRIGDVLEVGDVVAVEAVAESDNGEAYPEYTYALRQIPDVQGALVALDPHTGRVLAMSGGFSPETSEFNRVTQAMRQPGSAFKPFVYVSALESGFTPATVLLDAPFVMDQGPGLGKWKPANYTNKFYGPSTMRLGIEKSRNLMTVRLAQKVGMERIVEYAARFGVIDDLEPQLAMALGAGETTLLRLTAGYAMLVNGGKRIQPTLIDRVQDRHGETIFRHDDRDCASCRVVGWEEQAVPLVPDTREQLADPISAYQIVSMLEGVVQRGTGVRVRAVGKPIGGKTGTTNNSNDTWFIGFSPDLAAGVYVGFDRPRSLGPRETGSSVAAPVFRDFAIAALEGEAAIPFRIPPGVRLVRVNAETGQLARPGDARVILEAFRPGTVPGENVIRDPLTGAAFEGADGLAPSTATTVGTGGLY